MLLACGKTAYNCRSCGGIRGLPPLFLALVLSLRLSWTGSLLKTTMRSFGVYENLISNIRLGVTGPQGTKAYVGELVSIAKPRTSSFPGWIQAKSRRPRVHVDD